MLSTTGVLLVSLAVICVSLEAIGVSSAVRRAGHLDDKPRGVVVGAALSTAVTPN